MNQKPSEYLIEKKELLITTFNGEIEKIEIPNIDSAFLELINYLDEQHEQNTQCDTCNDDPRFTCAICGRKCTQNAYGNPLPPTVENK